MARDEAWGGEAISQMSQQQLKIESPRSPNRGKRCLLQIVSFFCHPATPARAGAAEVAGQSLPTRHVAIQGLVPDTEPFFGGNNSTSLSPWWVLDRGVSVAEDLQKSADFGSGAAAAAAAGFVA